MSDKQEKLFCAGTPGGASDGSQRQRVSAVTRFGRTTARSAGLILAVALLPGCFILHRHRSTDLATRINPGDQPDQVLYEKAVNEIKHGRYDVGRLTLQTLINTYPDSEYLAKAKLAIADSYYNEGGVSGLTQAEAEYKDFITFFPTAPEAPEAQFRAGMSHFKLMGKYDRDRTEAGLAEAEFKEFLRKYPDSPVMPRVKARLREVQELLAQSDYEIARYYYLKGANPAARIRFQEIADKYPDYSQADHALWYLGQTLERLRQPTQAATFYARIITDYPLSPDVRLAKLRLAALRQPIPKPTKAMLARARADAADRRRRSRLDVISEVEGVMSSSPDVSRTRHGPVRVGEPPTGTVEEAKAPAPSPGTASVSVEQLGDSDPGPAKPEEQSPTPAAVAPGGPILPATPPGPSATAPGPGNSGNPSNSAGAAAPTPNAPAGSASSKTPANTSTTPDSSTDTPPPKKSRFHFLKKLIPF
ncbi:MAG TPA: outer membrane protein assembly factor BamD [Terriglobia bacterium]|nr:outer membrane protein assembly factor BamD [Terriglobia bacterium]